MSEFFRTKIRLANGEQLYEGSEGRIVCRGEARREGREVVQRALIRRGEFAYSAANHTMRPVWTFPPGENPVRIVAFENEPADEPLDSCAHLLTGEEIGAETELLYLA